jgi:class 3 adenylate cyclase/tetratricopeptide (TPR) repeat protein
MAETDKPDRETPPHGDGRRHYLAVLFADLSESTRIAAAMESEEFAELLEGLRHAYEEIIPKHGGTIIRIVGDGVLASFGFPVAREDDGRRATEAALDLHDAVRRLHLDRPLAVTEPLHLHSGIHAGLVLLDEGDSISGRIRLVGNAVNIAARLSDAAERDEILVSVETLGAEKHFFRTDADHTLKMQGIDRPITVCRVIERAPVGTRFEARTKRGLTPFAGRQTELQTLMAGLHDTIAGKPRYLAVVAPAGLGKTRLTEEFLSRVTTPDVQIFRGYCESYLSAEPLQPFLQMLRSLCGLTYGMSAALASEALQQKLLQIDSTLINYRQALLRALSLAVPDEGENKAGEHGSISGVAALTGLFDALAAKKPTVLFIDDWQWADDATRQVLSAIRSLDRRSILVVVASRESAPGDVGMSDAQILRLMPLSEDEAEQAIAHLLPGTNKFVTAEIRGYAGGNPLFVEELCHFAHDHADRRSGHTHSAKAWLDMLIEARVERLPPAQIELVRTAAVIGNVIPSQVLESITGCGADHPFVLALTEQDLIYPGKQRGTLRFKHGIARDVIYEAVGLRQRKALHRQIAETLRHQVSSGLEEELCELLAYHYGASQQATDAAHYAELAGDKAMAASALDRARVQYLAALAALDLTEPSDNKYRRWMRIAEHLALVCVFDPSSEQLEVLLRAVDLAAARDDQQRRARAEYCVGYVYYALGKSGQAMGYLEVALDRALRVDDNVLVRQIRATLGQAYAAACDYDKATELLDEAIIARRQRRRSNRPGVGFAYTLACKASVLGDRGQFEEAYQCFDEALAAVTGAGHEVEGSVLCWRSGVTLWQGRWDEARRCALEAQRVAERVKSLYLYAMSLSIGAYATWMTERTAASLQIITDATSWLESHGKTLFISLNYGWLAEGMVSNKEWRAVRRYAARALMRRRNHDRIGEAMAYRAMALTSAAGQSRKSAELYLALARSSAFARESPHELALTQLCEAEIRLGRGQRAQAASLLDQAGSAFEDMAMSWHLDAVRRLQREL